MANQAPNFKILSGSIQREEEGKRKTYERGESIFMTEKQAKAYGLDLLERLGESDVVTRSGELDNQAAALADQEAKLRAMNEDLAAREKALATAQEDLAIREAQLSSALAKLKEDQEILIEATADLNALRKAMTAREDALADAEAAAKAKADAEAKAGGKAK